MVFAARTAFDDASRTRKLLVLVTDGGDQGRDSSSASHCNRHAGLHLSIIGVGDPRISAVVLQSETDPTPFLYRAQPVQTVLEEGKLRSIGGRYEAVRDVIANPTTLYGDKYAIEGCRRE